MDLNDLAGRMDAMLKRLPKAQDGLQKEVALDVLTHAVRNTPVDTSKALSNWVIGFESPVRIPREAHHQGEGGSTREASIQRTIQIAKARLESFDGAVESIWVSNNAPYINRLNDGYSPQGSGFVQAAVRKGRLSAKRRGAKLKLSASVGSLNSAGTRVNFEVIS